MRPVHRRLERRTGDWPGWCRPLAESKLKGGDSDSYWCCRIARPRDGAQRQRARRRRDAQSAASGRSRRLESHAYPPRGSATTAAIFAVDALKRGDSPIVFATQLEHHDATLLLKRYGRYVPSVSELLKGVAVEIAQTGRRRGSTTKSRARKFSLRARVCAGRANRVGCCGAVPRARLELAWESPPGGF
jgi:hypothetical protein